jgi:hypothetical protein
MVSGIDEADWEVVAAHARSLLKPGGAIQWTEADFINSSYLRSSNMRAPDALKQVGKYFHQGLGYRLKHGHSELPAILAQQKFSMISQDILGSDRLLETRSDLTRISYAGIFGWAYQMYRKRTSRSWTPEEIKGLERRCEVEITEGSYCRFDIYVTIGFAD